MRHLWIGLVLLLLLGPAWADPDAPAEPAEALAPDVATLVQAALDAGITEHDVEPLVRAAWMAHGTLDPVFEHLSAIHTPPEGDAEPEAGAPVPAAQAGDPDAARWVASRLARRKGTLRTALDLVDAMPAGEDAPLALSLHRAWLQDATGRTRDAFRTLQTVLPRVLDEERAATLRLRLALMGKDGNQRIKETLTAFAKKPSVDDTTRNRVAIVLALKDHPDAAIELYRIQAVEGPKAGSARFRQEIRRTSWALAADKVEKARTFAWNALQAATLTRDQRYALSILVEAYRAEDGLDALIERFAKAEDLSEAARQTWIDLLRETGRPDEALTLFRASAEGDFTVEMRRELLEICRESGREDALVTAYDDLIQAEPDRIEWREGLSRFHLESGRAAEASAVWTTWLAEAENEPYLLEAAEALMGLGLDDLATRAAEAAIQADRGGRYAALIFLHGLHKRRGRMDEAAAVLERMDSLAPADVPARADLGEAWERFGRKEKAVEVLEALREARGPARSGEDLEMRLAWLHSEVGNEDQALARWQDLWQRVESVPRRRYVEDRLMAVASRLGKLADITIELEEKLAAGNADARDAGMLVRLYTKANDPVSATEIIEEYMKRTGGDPVKALVEKARVFMSCTDYHNYEKTIRRLIRIDPDGRGDYLRQLAMSQLERGKPDEAREVLADLRASEDGSDSAEFEAGVLSLAGMREEAVQAYRKGIARFPERIESYLLMANLLRQTGQQTQAIGMFQHLVTTATRDDLFTIAIDGLLNVEAPAGVVRWARRQVLERLAARHDKMYLYQLLSDLSEEDNDKPGMLRALEASLPIAGERRSSVLRELMDLSRPNQRGTTYIVVNGVLQPRSQANTSDQHLTFGRRLIGLRETAPPQVYLDLGQAFLQAEEVTNAARTFSLAKDVPDHAAFQRLVAGAFEGSGYRTNAKRVYERLLASQPGDVSLMLKVGELHEQLGRDDRAAPLHRAALDLLFRRRPRSTFAKKEDDEPRSWWNRNRNVDEFDQHHHRALQGVLTTADEDGGVEALLASTRKAVEADLAWAKTTLAEMESEAPEADPATEDDDETRKAQRTLRAFPRLQARLSHLRRLAFTSGQPRLADAADLATLAVFPDDEKLLESLIKTRLAWGYVASARQLLDGAARDAEAKDALRYLVGGSANAEGGFLNVKEGSRLFLPLVASGRNDDARALLQRLDLGSVGKDDLEVMPSLLSTAVLLEDGGAALSLARVWLRTLVKQDKTGNMSWTVRPILARIKGLLPADKYKDLVQYLVGLILDDLEKAGGWLNLLPELQRQFEDPLVDAEALDQLIDKVDGNRWYWVGSFFALVPHERHGEVLRRVLPKVPASRQMQFLLQLVGQLTDEATPAFRDLLVDSFEASLEHVEQGQPYVWYVFSSLANTEKNQALAMRIAQRASEREGIPPIVKAAHAVLLAKSGKPEEGAALAVEVHAALRNPAPNDFAANMARNLVEGQFLPDHVDVFLAALAKEAEEGGDPLDLLQRRLDLILRAKKPEEALAAVEAAATEHPEEVEILKRLERAQRSAGQPVKAMGTLERLIELESEDKSLKQRRLNIWRGWRHWVKALESKKALESRQGASAASKPDEDAEKKSRTYATVQDLKKAADAEDWAEARTVLRRLWRSFPVGEGTRGFRYFGGARNLFWPRETKKDGEKPKPSRGGLDAYKETVEEPPKPRSAYDVMAVKPLGEGELRRMIRTWEPVQLAMGGPVVQALAKAMTERLGREQAALTLRRAVESGQAGKLEYGILLTLLEEDPEGVLEDARAFLDDLAQSMTSTDAAQIRRLARIQASLGEPEAAARLYRWAAAQVSGQGGGSRVIHTSGGVIFTSGGGGTSAMGLVKDVAETLEGDLKIRTIEQILAISKPQPQTWQGPTWRDGWDMQVLNTWIEVVGPDEALERCRDIATEVQDLEKGLRRGAARICAWLLARSGDTQGALRCLEVALCKHEPVGIDHPWQARVFEMSGSLSHQDFRRLFPSDASAYEDSAAWFQTCADALLAWVEAERFDKRRAFQPLALLALRRHFGGDIEGARAMLDALAEMAEDQTFSLLWVIDVARRLGDEDRAYALEKGLLEKRMLHFERIGEVLGRVAERDGWEEALERADHIAGYTMHDGFLTAVVDLAREHEDEDALERYEQMQLAARAAKEILDPKKKDAD